VLAPGVSDPRSSDPCSHGTQILVSNKKELGLLGKVTNPEFRQDQHLEMLENNML
jgi:hypothetical protein